MTTITVEVGLDEFNDDDIREEYEARGLGDTQSNDERKAQLRNIRLYMNLGEREKAYSLMYDYIRDELGTAI